jgi:hypothetical protein
VVHLDGEGCDFLGFNIRRYRGKLLTKPSAAALRRIRERLTTEVLALRGANAEAVVAKLNPIIKGWAAYYRIGVSKRAFASLDHHMWRLTYTWATFSHPNKSKRWAVAWYFGEFNKSRHDRWVFGHRASGRYLTKFAWTPIVGHRMVPGTASVDDPALADFWVTRRRRRQPPLATSALRLLRTQDGRCPLCGALLLHADHEPQHPDEWEQWFKAVRLALRKHAVSTEADHGTPDEPAVPRLVHAHCRRRRTFDVGGSPALCPPVSLQGLLEPDAVGTARPVLRGIGGATRRSYPAGWVSNLEFSPTGSTLAHVGTDGIAGLWDPVTGQLRNTLTDKRISSLAFSPDGSMLATADLDGNVQLRDPASGQSRYAFIAATSSVGSLVFNPNGSTLASTDRDGVIRLWNVMMLERR